LFFKQPGCQGEGDGDDLDDDGGVVLVVPDADQLCNRVIVIKAWYLNLGFAGRHDLTRDHNHAAGKTRTLYPGIQRAKQVDLAGTFGDMRTQPLLTYYEPSLR
jgi:hypothetical protein